MATLDELLETNLPLTAATPRRMMRLAGAVAVATELGAHFLVERRRLTWGLEVRQFDDGINVKAVAGFMFHILE